jgi:bifunctional DNase/RNase
MSDDTTAEAEASAIGPDPEVAVDETIVIPDEAGVDPDTVQFNLMSVESVLYDLSDSSPLVHLTESDTPYRYLAIPIALPEAVALHNALDKIDGRRPGTHEVMSKILQQLKADIVAARITRYENGVFYAELDVMSPSGHDVFDCRTSDALILATRQSVRAPVLCAESVLRDYYA